MNPKLAVAVLIAIVILFMVAVSTGAFHSSNSTQAGWLDFMKSTPDPVQLRQATASPSSCLVNNVVSIASGGICVLHVSGGLNTRRMRLTVQAGSANVHATQPPDSKDKPGLVLDDENLGSGATASIDIYQKGADVTITCTSIQACSLA